LVNTDVIAALPMFLAVDDDALQLLDTPLNSIRRSVGVTVRADWAPSAGGAALLAHLREEGARLAGLEDQGWPAAGRLG
jgi:hypothetical protein